MEAGALGYCFGLVGRSVSVATKYNNMLVRTMIKMQLLCPLLQQLLRTRMTQIVRSSRENDGGTSESKENKITAP